MTTPPKPSPRLHLPHPTALEEGFERGYLSNVLVELGPDQLYPVFFTTPARLAGELSTMRAHGEPYIIETGMILVHEITRENLDAAVAAMLAEGWFEYQVPLTRARVDAAPPFEWPP
jgi:hypothetical protein